jgi:hypothetical protein
MEKYMRNIMSELPMEYLHVQIVGVVALRLPALIMARDIPRAEMM